MKTDRLYGITVYLLNHGKTSNQSLQENLKCRFERYKEISIAWGRLEFQLYLRRKFWEDII